MDDPQLIDFIEGLAPPDFASLLSRFPAAANQVSDGVPQKQRVADLIRYAHSTGGMGIDALRQAVEQLFPTVTTRLSSVTIETLRSEARRALHVPEPTQHFVGRAEVFDQIHQHLVQSQRVALQGTPGVGKTHTAFKYTRDKHNLYTYGFYIRADSAESLLTGYAAIATLHSDRWQIGMRTIDAADAGRDWLTENENWLIVLDNVDDASVLTPELLPPSNGFVLVTGRDPAIEATAPMIPLHKLSEEDGGNCLLAHAGKRNATDAECADANALSREMDGLPLALEQAGRYILQARCGVAGYQTLYRQQKEELLDSNGARVNGDARTVYKIFTLAVQEATKDAPSVEELLRHAAYLASDNIIEGLFTVFSDHYPEPLRAATANGNQWNKTLAAALRLGLIHRDEESKSFSMHRLLQDVLRSRPAHVTPEEWSSNERSTIERLINIFRRCHPGYEFPHWATLDSLLPHQRACIDCAKPYDLVTEDFVYLLSQIGIHLTARASYNEASAFLHRTVEKSEIVFGPIHIVTADSLLCLVGLFQAQGKHNEAELLSRRALYIHEQIKGSNHISTAKSLTYLAMSLDHQGK